MEGKFTVEWKEIFSMLTSVGFIDVFFSFVWVWFRGWALPLHALLFVGTFSEFSRKRIDYVASAHLFRELLRFDWCSFRWYPINLIGWKHVVSIVPFFAQKLFLLLRMMIHAPLTYTLAFHPSIFPRGWINFSFVVRPTKNTFQMERMKRKFLPFHRIFQFENFSWSQTHSQKQVSVWVGNIHFKHDPNQWAKAELSIGVCLLFWSFTEIIKHKTALRAKLWWLQLTEKQQQSPSS